MMEDTTPALSFLQTLLYKLPSAAAAVTGNEDFPDLNGIVRFYATPYGGTLIESEFFELPVTDKNGGFQFYGFHIHENGDCTMPFSDTGAHYNPTDAKHPLHYGDLIPLFGNNGYAWSCFYNERINIAEIMGKSIVVHEMPDDFTTQPSGNSGEKIGCGVIKDIS